MPVIDGMGYSECTPAKQADFRYLVSYHLGVVNCMIAKAQREGRTFPPPEYWYFDITAGKGTHPETGDPGSPLIFAQEAWEKQAPVRMWCIEEVAENCAELAAVLAEYPVEQIVCGDHSKELMQMIPQADRPRLGLLYCDPSGNIPPFDLLAEFASNRPTSRIDLLIYLSATTIKRCCGAFPEKGFKRLPEYLAAIPKDDWLLRIPQASAQWTFALGTKWSKFPPFPQKGFLKLGTPEGDALMDRLAYPESYEPPTLPDL